MFSDVFMNVLAHDGVVAIVSWADGNAHVVNTWNKYITVVDDKRFLIPAAGMRKTEKNVAINNKVKLTIGSHEVMGHKYMGTGFLLEATAQFIQAGSEFDMMREKFPFLTRVLEITVDSIKRTL